jgi:hypothetical protein
MMPTLYDLLAGQNPYADMALAIVAIDKHKVPRYRDATILRPTERDPTWRVSILTRCGSAGVGYDLDVSGLTGHTLYLSHQDMTVDPTYAAFDFMFPVELAGLGPWIVSTERLEGDDRVDAWVTLFNKLNKLKTAFPESVYVLSMKTWIAPVMQQLVDSGKIDVVDVS